MVLVKAGKYLKNRRKKHPQEKSFMLGVDKPELFLCAHFRRKIFSVLTQIADFEQTIILTNCPNFVDIAKYESILLMQREPDCLKFQLQQASSDVLVDFERESFNLNKELTDMDSMLFFAGKIILIENRNYSAALLQAVRNMGLVKLCPEEIDYSIFSMNNKAQMIFFIKLLNAFKLRYTILIESGDDPDSEENKILKDISKENKLINISGKFQEVLGVSADINQLNNFNQFLISPLHPSAAFRNIIHEIFDISNQQKEVYNGQQNNQNRAA